MKRIYWGDYTSFEIKELIEQDPVIIIPIGAYEQHGPHLTINTDKKIAESICEEIVKKSEVPCSMLPSLWIGISEHHMRFSGSLTLKHDTMSLFIFDLIEGLVRNGVTKVLVLNSHGGNMVAANEALTRASIKFGGTFIMLTYWNLVSEEVAKNRHSEFGGISHACELETSLQLYLNSEDVRVDMIPPANNIKGSSYWSPEMFASNKVSMYIPYEQISELGHIGEPQKATIEFGELIFKAIISKSIKLIEAIQKGRLLDANY